MDAVVDGAHALADTGIAATRAETASTIAAARRNMLAVVVAALVFGVIVWWGLSRTISRPLKMTVAALDRVAAGDLTQRDPGRVDRRGRVRWARR